ncbi:TIGR02679 family protein [Neobacillus cucumis]|uniref:TIGR02679 family protein n=1 Tax=Neobacillus cucumis TaxID=1740721 RepID=UPI002E21F46E|nr:TIGR02679 family protein [Neobacillus cucumis]
MNRSVQILREEAGFHKLFKLFKDKYRSLGRIGGTVSTRSFTKKEMESIAGFLGQSADWLLEKGKISLLDFEQELTQTVFSGYSLLQLLEEVLEETIVTKQEENHLEKQKDQNFFQQLRLEYPEGSWWWDWIESKPPEARWIWSLYKQNPLDFFEKVTMVFKAFQETPSVTGKFERLPLFAQRTTGNPHYFDNGSLAGKLLIYCMYVDQQLKGLREAGVPTATEELNELLSSYGLMRDDLWSFVSCRGFFAKGEMGTHPVWVGAAETETVLNVPIKELLKLKEVWPVKGNKVWIVENSSVCSTIVDEVPGAPIICTHGQFRAASWVLLNYLVESGCVLYYSGDLDPEGITMAQRLKDRFPNQVIFWRMDTASYLESISDEDISSRLSKMQTITSSELVEVANALMERKKAGYQEGLVQSLIKDIRREY